MAYSPVDLMAHFGSKSIREAVEERVSDRSFPTVVKAGKERPSYNRVYDFPTNGDVIGQMRKNGKRIFPRSALDNAQSDVY